MEQKIISKVQQQQIISESKLLSTDIFTDMKKSTMKREKERERERERER